MDLKRRALFLGYGAAETELVGALAREMNLEHSADSVVTLAAYDLVISYGYRHILKPNVLVTAKRPPINLHIAYLPFNRGAHPNFWSWMEGTPAGVTIHHIDEGIDTGDIIYQAEFNELTPDLTFSQTYAALRQGMDALFLKNMQAIIAYDYEPQPQTEDGTFHFARQLPQWMTDWSMRISDAQRRFHSPASA